jgi:NifB/MoaA-like Fe-S oxidoreductase
MSLRWLRALLNHGIEVHGQIVVCPDVNDKDVLDDTLAGILERFPDLASAAAVPLGTSRFSGEQAMRPHRPEEAVAVLDTIERWQGRFQTAIGRRMIFAADEYYLLAGRPFPELGAYEGLPQEENGIGVARAFEASFVGRRARQVAHRGGFFASVDGAPAAGYRAPRTGAAGSGGHTAIGDGAARVHILTGRYGAMVLRPLLDDTGYDAVEVVPIENAFFGGNIAVAGLLTGADVTGALERLPVEGRYLLPDVCLSEGRFLDGVAVEDLPRPVEVVETTGAALRRALRPRLGLAGSSPFVASTV